MKSQSITNVQIAAIFIALAAGCGDPMSTAERSDVALATYMHPLVGTSQDSFSTVTLTPSEIELVLAQNLKRIEDLEHQKQSALSEVAMPYDSELSALYLENIQLRHTDDTSRASAKYRWQNFSYEINQKLASFGRQLAAKAEKNMGN